MTAPSGDPLARDSGPVPDILSARRGAPCLPAGLSLFDAPLPALRQAIEACRARAAQQARQARDARRQAGACPGCLPAGEARYGRLPGFQADIATSHLPDSAKHAMLEFQARVDAGEVRFGLFTGDARGEVSHAPTARTYTDQPTRDRQRAADIELCKRYASRLHIGDMLCPDS